MTLDTNETVELPEFCCPHCERTIPVDATKSGMESTCPHCSSRIVFPPLNYAAPSPSKVERTMEQVFPANFTGLTISAFLGEQGVKQEPGIELDGEQHDGHKALETEHGQRYEVGETVAKGGMGAILAAKDVNIRRSVAMKVMLQKRKIKTPELLRFIEEAQVTGQLEHPNIVPVHELGLDAGGHVFYTMKFVRGITLKDVLTKIRMGNREMAETYSLNHLLNIFLKVCDAVAFAHSKGVIHRDLKPENVMIGDYGEVLVLDWGLAKIIGRPESLTYDTDNDEQPDWIQEDVSSYRIQDDSFKTMAGTIMGTPTFMSPEQARGEIDATGPRSDIYSLGGILYNILTLHTPIERDSVNELLVAIVAGRIEPPQYWNPDGCYVDDGKEETTLYHCPGRRIPDALDAVAMKALALEAEDRYADVKELQADIEAWQTGFATRAEEAGLARQVWLLLMRHKAVFSTVGAALLVLVVVVTGFVLSLQASYREEQRARIAEQEQKDAALAAKAKAEGERLAKERELYYANIAFAKECLYATPGRPALAQEVLANCDPRYRHFEWRFLKARADRSGRRFAVGGWQAPMSWHGRMAMSPDGAVVVVAADTQVATGGCRLWWFIRDGDSWQPHEKAFKGLGSARSVALDASGKYAAVQGTLGTQVVDLKTETIRAVVAQRCPGLLEYVDVQVDRIGFRAAAGEDLRHFALSTVEGQGGNPVPVKTVAVPRLAATRRIATSLQTSFRLDGGSVTLPVTGAETSLSNLYVGPNRQCLVATRGDCLAVYEMDTLKLRWQRRMAWAGIVRVCVAANGRYLAAAGSRTSRLMSAVDGKPIGDLPFAASAFAFSSDSRVLAVAEHGRVHLVTPATGKELAGMAVHDVDIQCLTFSDDDHQIISVSGSQVVVTDVAAMTDVPPAAGIMDFAGNVVGMDCEPQTVPSGCIATATSDRLYAMPDGALVSLQTPGKVRVRRGNDVREDELSATWKGNVLMGVGSSATGKCLLFWGGRKQRRSDLVVTAVQADNMRELWSVQAPAVLATHRFDRLMSVSDELWSGGEKKMYPVTADPAYSGQARWFVAGKSTLYAGDCRVNYRSGKYVIVRPDGSRLEIPSGMRVHTGRLVPYVSLSESSGRMAIMVRQTDVQVVDVKSGKTVCEMTGGQAPVAALCIFADGQRVATWGRDGTLRLWHAETGKELLSFEVIRPVTGACTLGVVSGSGGLRGVVRNLRGKSQSFVMATR